MTRLETKITSLFFVAAILGACGPERATSVDTQNDKGPQNNSSTNATNNSADDCPDERPEYGARCDHPPRSRCDYFISESFCFPGVSDYDIYDHCECEEGRWRCSPDYEDCLREENNHDEISCPADSPEDESSCDAGLEGWTCDYFVRGSYCMPGVSDYDIYNHCDCIDGSWNCRQDFEDCFPQPDAGADG